MLYLDEAASASLAPSALQAMQGWLTAGLGNPASVHAAGKTMAGGLEAARAVVAAALGTRADRILWTSGGSESNAAAVMGIARAVRGRDPKRTRVLTSAIEHSSIHDPADALAQHEGFSHERIPVDAEGLVSTRALEDLLDERVAVVAVMAVNNEVGAVQPLARIRDAAHRAGAVVICDAVAASPKNFTAIAAQCDALTLSGHKFGAPQGIGVLALQGAGDRLAVPFLPLMPGAQEKGRRAGTPNTAGAIALAAALQEALDAPSPPVSPAQQMIEAVLSSASSEAQLTGPPAGQQRSDSIASFVFPGISGEALLIELEMRGVLCSSGSACHAGSTEPSHVLRAMGYEPAIARSAIRFSHRKPLTEAQLENLRSAVAGAVGRLRPKTSSAPHEQ